jgi:tetratricopeptide (TPR) repeat protein
MYNPFFNHKQNGASKSSSRISASKIKNLNNTISHARSYSNCSKRDFQLSSKRSGISYNQSSTIQRKSGTQNLNIPESQLLESEEYFEQGKVFLSDKKYKEAIKAFSKCLQLNKENYDALFYRGVTYLD